MQLNLVASSDLFFLRCRIVYKPTAGELVSEPEFRIYVLVS